MNLPERAMLAMSLPQLLANLKPEVIERTQAIAYPLILAAGLGVYGYRVYTLVERKAAARRSQAAAPSPEAAPAGPQEEPAAPAVRSGNGLGAPDQRGQFGDSIRGVP